MNNLLIKMCGFRDQQLAQQAVQLGVNYIGLVFHQPSKRNVDIALAAKIAASVKKAGGQPVAVFATQTASEMQSICHATNINIIQLHGSIPRQQHYLLSKYYQRIYVCPVTPEGQINPDFDNGMQYLDPERDFVLYDNIQAGIGKYFDWNNFKHQNKLTSPFRWFLSGGLNPANIQLAMQQLHPNGVDVSSGIENNPGQKDLGLMTKFMQAVRGQVHDVK